MFIPCISKFLTVLDYRQHFKTSHRRKKKPSTFGCRDYREKNNKNKNGPKSRGSKENVYNLWQHVFHPMKLWIYFYKGKSLSRLHLIKGITPSVGCKKWCLAETSCRIKTETGWFQSITSWIYQWKGGLLYWLDLQQSYTFRNLGK